MQRFISIATMVALVATLLPSTMSMPCAQMASGKRMMCHRQAAGQAHAHTHHCDGIEANGMEAQENLPSSAPQAFVGGADNSQQCPMSCCGCARAKEDKNPAIIPQTEIVFAFVIQGQIFVHPVVFHSNGFSSHTDRGPPSNTQG